MGHAHKIRLCIDCGKPFKDSDGLRCKKCMEKRKEEQNRLAYPKRLEREKLENETD